MTTPAESAPADRSVTFLNWWHIEGRYSVLKDEPDFAEMIWNMGAVAFEQAKATARQFEAAVDRLAAPRAPAPDAPSADTMNRITRGIEQYAAHHPSTASTETLREWMRKNMTFYNTAERNKPVRASVAKRIWYHATDDMESYPFDSVIDAALSGDQGAKI